MPYYVKGDVPTFGDLLSLRPAGVAERGIALRRHHDVVAVDSDGGTVTVAGPEGRFDQPHGDLLVATGATPIASPICGVDLEGAFRMHHMDSAAAMRPYLEPAGVDAGIDVPSVDAALVERLAAQEPPGDGRDRRRGLRPRREGRSALSP